MQRGQLTYPVLADHRCLPLRLDDIDGEVLAQHRDVDRLAECAGQLIGQRSGLLGQFELHVDAASESYEPEAQAIFSALGILLDHLARLERTQQAKRRGLVHPDLAGDLADPAGAPARQQFENLQGAVHRLETAAGIGVRYGHGVPSRILTGDATIAGGALVRGLGLSPATYRFAPRTRSEPSGSCHCLSQLQCRMVQRCARRKMFARSATCRGGLPRTPLLLIKSAGQELRLVQHVDLLRALLGTVAFASVPLHRLRSGPTSQYPLGGVADREVVG